MSMSDLSHRCDGAMSVDPLASPTALAGLLSALIGETVSRRAAYEIRTSASSIAARALVRLLRMPPNEREALIKAHLKASRGEI